MTDVFDKDKNVPGKPRLAEVLGVEKGQKFRVDGFKSNRGEYIFFEITDNGFDYEPKGATEIGHAYALIDAINHPELIIRAPRLTEPEIAIMRAVGAKWVSRDTYCDDGSVELWGKKPWYVDGMYDSIDVGGLIATIHNSEIFPSVHPGECIAVENI